MLAFPSSDLSRNAPRVFAAAEEAPVSVTRRDGENLVLMSQRDSDSREQLLQFAAQLIAVAIDDRGSLAERMANAYPWMLALGQADRVRCAADLVDAARASFATGQAHLIAAELTSWRETATALAAGLVDSPVDWLGDEIRVDRP
ncbi:prevent-host-death protein [Herbiconiux daphne]|uniref:Prevent-host-death protein n=1 Tax=Herbiconiux daphne TaxID=2970914 RepID=A0ABT2GYA6_9MICO|nr:prevent-host-death protein [Herbiconiux daphne]MCS5732898.1 prevent-host-death protein [Herbiconiux daphne]